MAKQGCPHEGADHRFNPWGITCWLQRLLTFRSEWEPLSISFHFPLHFALNVPIGPRRLFSLRIGLWRYDRNARAYIGPTGKVKVGDTPIFY